MKKFLFLLMAGTMLCGGAYAKHDCDCSDCRAKMERKMMTGGQGGFVDAAAKPLSVAEVQKLSDDAYVTMEGILPKGFLMTSTILQMEPIMLRLKLMTKTGEA